MAGTLYLCATPIGNLEDMTFRAVRVLKEAAVIAAEDTRHTRKLLSHFDIHTPLVSYHEHNKALRGPQLLERLLAGEDVAVVSDAGLPGIADPGADLAQLALAAGCVVIPVPGANAALTALVGSGLDPGHFLFVGFLPRAAKHRQAVLQPLANLAYTLIVYEAPHRLRATIKELARALGNRQAAAARELTKVHEEFVRGTLAELEAHFTQVSPRGEFTLIIAGAEEGTQLAGESGGEETTDALSLAEAVAARVRGGMTKKEAIRQVATDKNLSKRVVYQAVLEQGEDND